MEPLTSKQRPRYREIDLLRFLAALAVVLYHYTFLGILVHKSSPVRYERLEPFTKYGYLGVQLFFIISGYVILLSAYDKTVKDFFISRIVRLYPAFWTACTLCFLVVFFFGPRPGDGDWYSNWSISPARYVFNMTMLEEFFGVAVMDGPYWTLTYELTFYFLVSLLIGYSLMRHLTSVILFWLLYTAFTGPAPVVQTSFFGLFMPNYSPYFIAGMLFFLLQRKLITPWKLYGLLGITFLLAIRSERALALDCSQQNHSSFSLLVIITVIASFFAIFWLIASRRLNLERFEWLSTLGALTYPLYLLHNNIGFIFLKKFGPTTNKYVLLVALILLMVLAAYIIHKGVERRLGSALGQRLTQLLDYLP